MNSTPDGPDRLFAALDEERFAPALRELDSEGTLTVLIPELELGRGFTQPELHFYDVLDHNLATVAALDAVLGPGEDGREYWDATNWFETREMLECEVGGLPLRKIVRLACLLHDVAKPETAAIIEGRLRFPKHGPRGAEIMPARLASLGVSEEAAALIAKLIRYHLRPGELVRAWPPTDAAVRRFATALDGHVLPLMLVNLCDGMATRGPTYTRENFRRHLGFLNYIVGRSLAAFPEDEDALITGDDLLAELDMQSGRLLGDVLASVRRAAHEGIVRDREEALVFARRALAELKLGPG